jgi:hypothetical protein
MPPSLKTMDIRVLEQSDTDPARADLSSKP